MVAPLDFPAEGVLLLTTDGELAEKMSRGGGTVTMTYHLKFQGVVGDEDIGRLLRGLEVGAAARSSPESVDRAGHHRQEHLGRDGDARRCGRGC